MASKRVNVSSAAATRSHCFSRFRVHAGWVVGSCRSGGGNRFFRCGRLNLIPGGRKVIAPRPFLPDNRADLSPPEARMSTKLQQLGIDRWPEADRLALLQELRDSLPTGPTGSGNPPRHAASHPRRDRGDGVEFGRPWRDALTDLGGEG